MKPPKNRSNDIEDDGPRGGQDADAGTHDLRQAATRGCGFYGSGLVLGTESGFGCGASAALALGTEIQAGTEVAGGWRFELRWLVLRVVWVGRGPENKIGSGNVPLRPARGIING